ncbi:hypothetical protein D3C80_2030770 [compost metagenome]
MGNNALDAPIFNNKRLCGGIGEALKLASCFGLVNQLARNRLRTRNNEACIRVPQATLNEAFFD